MLSPVGGYMLGYNKNMQGKLKVCTCTNEKDRKIRIAPYP